MIKVKSIFNGWCVVNKYHAKLWAKNIYDNAVALKDNEKIKYINERLSGITAEELLNITK